MDFAIVTDSSSNLTKDIIDSFGLHILRLCFRTDDSDEVFYSYDKDKHIDLGQFYREMREGVVYKTSLPNVADSEVIIEDLLREGKDILYIGFSSGLSGTYESTSFILSQFAEKYPERKMFTVDTLGASGGEGMLVYLACKLAAEGKPIEEVYQWVEDHKFHLAHWFTVGDLEYLYRGGRVSRASAFAGGLLQIKPVMHMDNEGHLVPVGKVRGRKKSIHAMFEKMKESIISRDPEQHVFITHADCIEDAHYLADLIKKEFSIHNININFVDPVIGAHCGPGTLALFFLAKQR